VTYLLTLPSELDFGFDPANDSSTNLDSYCMINAIISFYLAGILAIMVVVGVIRKVTVINPAAGSIFYCEAYVYFQAQIIAGIFWLMLS